MKKVFFVIYIFVFALLPFLNGCLNLERGYPEKRYFVLDVSRDKKNSNSSSGVAITVRRFSISPQYEGKGLIYKLSDLNYVSDFYNEFFVLPVSVLTEEVQQWMVGSGLYSSVVTPSSYIEPTQVLEGKVTALYGDYSEGTSHKAVLEIHLFLLNRVSDSYGINFQKRYRVEETLPTDTPDDLVKGWNRALKKILTEFEADLRLNIPPSKAMSLNQ